MTALAAFAARPDVKGVVLPVDGEPAVAAAYDAWNANPCPTTRPTRWSTRSPGSSSGSATAPSPVSHRIPTLANVVVVGGDDIVPMARLDDTTRVGNETGYADEFDVNGPYFGALETSHFLSDDPYGDLDPMQWATRRLYVPELAIGRLVESPDQIIAQLDAYADASGRLDASRGVRRRLRLHDRRRQLGARRACDRAARRPTARRPWSPAPSTSRRGPAPS